jgi:nitrogen regulatory protein P-II 1
MENASLNCVVGYIQPFQLDAVVDALRHTRGFAGLSVSMVRGLGAADAHAPRSGEKAEVDPFEPTLRLELYCRATDVIAMVEAIQASSHTGNPGDGKIFVSPVMLARRIRSGEWGEAALRP